MELHGIGDVGELELTSGLLLDVVWLQVQHGTDLLGHSFSVRISISECESVRVTTVDKAVDRERGETLTFELDAEIVH